MKMIFMGSSDYGMPVLKNLIAENFNIVSVYTKSDPITKIKLKQSNPIESLAISNQIPVHLPTKIDEKEIDLLTKIAPDIIIVAAYGLYLPPKIIDLPKFGCLNIHPSLLPKYRGPSPVISTILSDEKATGVSIIKINNKLDAGPMLKSQMVNRICNETAYDLTKRLFSIGSELLIDIIPRWIKNEISPISQKESDATFTKKITKSDGEIKWNLSSKEIYLKTLAYNPWPKTYSWWNGKRIILTKMELTSTKENNNVAPGTIIRTSSNKIAISTATTDLLLSTIQLEGKREISVQEFVLGHPTFINSKLK
ncbi:MAG: methionyl-tRNA formyltransferase [Chloroflexi bacterium]|nr:methionyl-tRNA formyltransferase [Chloroflexota bacterium]MQG05124.1 methionyl-tRNA formyltransferase [SAR202 cluster bacterium]|tara:strand:- start:32122 stop:33051 length:930 start_codon:yes stop_codon:yes gene_type:complete